MKKTANNSGLTFISIMVILVPLLATLVVFYSQVMNTHKTTQRFRMREQTLSSAEKGIGFVETELRVAEWDWPTYIWDITTDPNNPVLIPNPSVPVCNVNNASINNGIYEVTGEDFQAITFNELQSDALDPPYEAEDINHSVIIIQSLGYIANAPNTPDPHLLELARAIEVRINLHSLYNHFLLSLDDELAWDSNKGFNGKGKGKLHLNGSMDLGKGIQLARFKEISTSGRFYYNDENGKYENPYQIDEIGGVTDGKAQVETTGTVRQKNRAWYWTDLYFNKNEAVTMQYYKNEFDLNNNIPTTIGTKDTVSSRHKLNDSWQWDKYDGEDHNHYGASEQTVRWELSENDLDWIANECPDDDTIPTCTQKDIFPTQEERDWYENGEAYYPSTYPSCGPTAAPPCSFQWSTFKNQHNGQYVDSNGTVDQPTVEEWERIAYQAWFDDTAGLLMTDENDTTNLPKLSQDSEHKVNPEWYYDLTYGNDRVDDGEEDASVTILDSVDGGTAWNNFLVSHGFETIFKDQVASLDPELYNIQTDVTFKNRAEHGISISPDDSDNITLPFTCGSGENDVCQVNEFWNLRNPAKNSSAENDNRKTRVIDIDVSKLASWAAQEGNSMGNGILYVEIPPTSDPDAAKDYTINGTSMGKIDGIRFVNTEKLPGKFTIASEGDIYIKGDYNTDEKTGSSIITNTVVYALSDDQDDTRYESLQAEDIWDTDGSFKDGIDPNTVSQDHTINASILSPWDETMLTIENWNDGTQRQLNLRGTYMRMDGSEKNHSWSTDGSGQNDAAFNSPFYIVEYDTSYLNGIENRPPGDFYTTYTTWKEIKRHELAPPLQ
jgi:hypothetical protein